MINGNVKVSEVWDNIDPDLKAFLIKYGDKAIVELMDKADTLNKDERMALLSLVYSDRGKFAPKLALHQRCEILALYRMGITREVLSKMYGVDRRTITHIYNPISPHYKAVRELEIGWGKDKFRGVYLNDELISKALAFRHDVEKLNKNNKFAKGKAGIHVVRGPNCSSEHRVRIAWHEKSEEIEVAGWYYQDLDGDFPGNWFCGDEESLRTSQLCYINMLHDITDRIMTT